MAVKATVNGDIKAVLRDLDEVDTKIKTRAVVMSLNRTANKVRTDGVRALANVTKIPQKVIRWKHDAQGQKTQKRRVTVQKANKRRLGAYIYFRTRAIPAILVGARQTKAGVRTRAKTYTGAFINNATGGGKQVYKRRGRKRYPIDVQKIEIVHRGDNIFKGLTMRSGRYFVKEFERNMKRMINKGRK